MTTSPDQLQLALRHHQAGQLQLAESLYRQILAQHPNNPDALHLLGALCAQLGLRDEGIALIRRAIAINPTIPDFHNNLGEALRTSNRLDEAVAAFRQAIALDPRYASPHSNLALALIAQNRSEEAIAALRSLIALEPANTHAHWLLGTLLFQKREYLAAIDAYQATVQLAPTHVDAFIGLGNALAAIERHDEAVAAFRKALELRPDSALAHANLGATFRSCGQIDDAVASLQRAVELMPDLAALQSGLIFTLHLSPDATKEMIEREQGRWDERFCRPLAPIAPTYANPPIPTRRLRIGYVSPDLYAHPVANFLRPILAHRDAQQVENFCYSSLHTPDGVTDLVRSESDQWRDVAALNDEQLAALIRNDAIDILVDLSMHTIGNRLLTFARKPAPVQISYLAYCSGAGLSTIDYHLTDPFIDPPTANENTATFDRPLHLETYWCYASTIDSPPIAPPPALAADHITFGSLNHCSKLSKPALRAWSAILRRIPTSRLLLLAPAGIAQERIKNIFAQNNVDPARLEFLPIIPYTQYLAQSARIDILLDPFPYGGGATTCDALWMGVPVITLRGHLTTGRGGASLLSALNLTDLIAETQEQYIELAVTLASDTSRLASLRSTLRPTMQKSLLMAPPRFARTVEAAYRKAWTTWCRTRSV